MNQAEIAAQRNGARIVRVTNPYDFEFTHAWGGIPYTLPVGKPLLFPYPLADHLATHLARQAAIRKAPMRDAQETDGKGSDRPLWDEDSIIRAKAIIMHEEYQETIPEVKTEAQLMAAKIEELNKAFSDLKASVDGTTPTTDPEVTTAPVETGAVVTGDPLEYQDKAEVIAELEKRGIKYDARASKAKLEELLK